jgi:hypothetical protein
MVAMRYALRLTLLSAAFAASCYGAAATAQTPPQPPESHWFDWKQNNYYQASLAHECGATVALYAEFNRNARQVAQAWGATPGSTGPDLYSQWDWMPSGCPAGVLAGALIYWPWPTSYFRMEAVPGHPGAARPHFINETHPLTLTINRPEGIEFMNQMNPKDKNEIGFIRVTRRIGGYPVYNNDHVLVIEAAGRSLYQPVTLSEALNRWITYAYSNEWATERHRALLAKLSPPELQRPAYLYHDENNRDQIVTEPGKDARPVVRYNPDYFDKTGSRAAAQLLTVDVHFLDLVRPPPNPAYSTAWYPQNLLNNADWQRIASLLH